MDYAIKPSNTERRVIFNLPPPFNVLWCNDSIYQRSIELCFLCYMRSGEQWLVDIESVLYEHLEVEYAEEMSEGFDGIIIDTINNFLYQLHQHHAAYSRAIYAVMGHFDPVLYDYLEVSCNRYQPDVEFIVQPKDAF